MSDENKDEHEDVTNLIADEPEVGQSGDDARDTGEKLTPSVIIDVPDDEAFAKLPPGIQGAIEEIQKEARLSGLPPEKLYRLEIQVHIPRTRDGTFERQIKLIAKFRQKDFEGEFTFDLGGPIDQHNEADGKPSFGITHKGLYIHLREGLLPDETGFVRGRFEINRRVVPVYQMLNPKNLVRLPDGTDKALGDFVDHPELVRLIATGVIPLSMFRPVVENEFLSVNIFPSTPDTPALGRMHVVVIPKAKRGDEEAWQAMMDQIERAKTTARMHGAFFSSGPDRNNAFVHVYPPLGEPYHNKAA